jgi:hypothetical protein
MERAERVEVSITMTGFGSSMTPDFSRAIAFSDESSVCSSCRVLSAVCGRCLTTTDVAHLNSRSGLALKLGGGHFVAVQMRSV